MKELGSPLHLRGDITAPILVPTPIPNDQINLVCVLPKIYRPTFAQSSSGDVIIIGFTEVGPVMCFSLSRTLWQAE